MLKDIILAESINELSPWLFIYQHWSISRWGTPAAVWWRGVTMPWWFHFKRSEYSKTPKKVRGCALFSFFFFLMADILNFEMSSSRIHPSKRRARSHEALPSTGLVLFECENTSPCIADAVEERNPGNISAFPILTLFLRSEIAG